jgi:hypothetical protein
MKHLQVFAAMFGAALAAGTAQAQPPNCYSQPASYYAAPATAYYAAPSTTYYAPPNYSSYYSRTYFNSYTPPGLVYGPSGVSYRTSSYTGYYPAFFPPSYGSGYYTSSYGGAVPSTSSYLPGTAYFTPSNSNTPGYNRVFLTIGDFHY